MRHRSTLPPPPSGVSHHTTAVNDHSVLLSLVSRCTYCVQYWRKLWPEKTDESSAADINISFTSREISVWPFQMSMSLSSKYFILLCIAVISFIPTTAYDLCELWSIRTSLLSKTILGTEQRWPESWGDLNLEVTWMFRWPESSGDLNVQVTWMLRCCMYNFTNIIPTQSSTMCLALKIHATLAWMSWL